MLHVTYDDGPQRAPNQKGFVREMLLKRETASASGAATFEGLVLQSQGLLHQPAWRKVTFKGEVAGDQLVLTSTETNPKERIVLKVDRAIYEDSFTPAQKRDWFEGTAKTRNTSSPVRAEELSRAGKVYETKYDPYWVKNPVVLGEFFNDVDESAMPAHR